MPRHADAVAWSAAQSPGARHLVHRVLDRLPEIEHVSPRIPREIPALRFVVTRKLSSIETEALTAQGKKFKIIIAGGGIAGLTLAAILEKFDIDYVLLESHGAIAPEVGVSIGLFPSGLRILDEIGCYEAMRALPEGDVGRTHIRNKNGKSISSTTNHRAHVEHRTKDGDSFKGSIVVGADGVYSTVRTEMFRLASEVQPDYIDQEEPEKVPCYCKCSFRQALTYWFAFSQLPETKSGKAIPKYSREDEAQFVKENAHRPITETITFGQVYERRISSTLTPLHEQVFKKWYFRRVFILGDAAHKPNPIGGQGGNKLDKIKCLDNNMNRLGTIYRSAGEDQQALHPQAVARCALR
ncbi:hypothetical protein diail_2101 [Diaporthe ilicicola]|nr:hypothetical protein diail_2101 [Diaporthe ilicicola]